ncbi:MAG: DUF1801 domain-containing protein [Phycisphaerales bacterium JB039]
MDAADEVRRFIDGTPPAQRDLIRALRQLVLEVAPGASETVLWRSLSYHTPQQGGRVKGAICLITPRADCVHVGFIHGAALPDPAGILRGEGKSKRHFRLRSGQVIPRDALAELIRAAEAHRPQ